MNPRTRALITVGLVITILTLFFLFIFIKQQSKTLSNAVYSEQHSLQKQMQLLIGQNSQRYRSRIKSLVTNRLKIVNAFAEKDRDKTFQLADQIFKLFKKENPYFRSFFFANPDNTIFLRVHRSDLHGDDVTSLSPVIKEGNQIKNMVSGFEIVKGGLQYRIVCPVFDNKEYVGLVGFGIDADFFIDQLRQIHHTYFHKNCEEKTHMAFVFPRAELHKSVFLDRPYKIIGKYVVFFNNGSLFQKLPEHVDLKKGLQQIKLNGLRHALVQGINFKGLKNNVIAEGFSLVNIESLVTETKNTIMLTIILYIALLFIAFIIIYLNFNLLFKKIAVLHNSLELNNKELEHRIEERTAELQQEINEHKLAEKEKIKLETKLRQAQKMESIGTLAGGIAHDFNNILFPIMGYTEMLLSDINEDSPFKERLDKIYISAIRARDLVSQILIFARQESNELRPLAIQPIIKETLKLLRSTIPTTIDIKHYIQAAPCVVKADPTQIHQIIMNLAINAYHAMEKNGGKLNVGLKEIILSKQDFSNPNLEPGTYALLSVADTGVGMSKEIIEKIFDPFFTTKEKGKGTGMGLSVVHGIAVNMGGAIEVYSEPGKGTEFKIYLPIEKSISEEQDILAKKPIKYGNEQILLVDDEEDIISMEKNMLERLGYKITSRTGSIEALEAFIAHPDKYDLVITDMAMPNMPGDTLASELIKIRADIPILLCTGFSETISEEKAASLGIKGFLLKPIVMNDLSIKIREVLDKN